MRVSHAGCEVGGVAIERNYIAVGGDAGSAAAVVSHAIGHRIGFAGDRFLEGILGSVETALIGDVLTQRQIPIDLLGQAGRRGIAAVLRD